MIYTTHDVNNTVVHVTRFSSLMDFYDTAINGTTDLPERERSSRNIEAGDDSWTKVQRFSDMEPLALRGWKEGREKVIPMADYLSNLIGSRVIRPNLTWDVAGGCVDVGKYLQGEPDCMLDFQSKVLEGAGKIVTITVNITASCHVNQQSIINRGAAICAFIDLLNQSGYTCELNCVETCRPSTGYTYGEAKDHQCDNWIPVKQAEDVLDEDAISFVLMHPGILRRFVFSLSEQMPAPVRKIFGFGGHGGYGRVVETPLSGEEMMGDIYLAPLAYDAPEWASTSSSSDWIIGQLKKLGFKLEGTD
jgi:hypothetical protein